MNFTSHVVVFCLAFMCSIKNVTPIICYDCNSAYDPRCGEEFDSFSLGVVNCSLRDPPEHIGAVEPTFCRTIKMEISSKVRIVRQCRYLTDNEWNSTTCRRLVGVGEIFVTYCACNTDLCNGVARNYQEMALIGGAILLMFLF